MQWKAFGSEQGVFGVFKFAQKKYGNVSSWRNKCPESKSRYLSAMMRHYFKIKNGFLKKLLYLVNQYLGEYYFPIIAYSKILTKRGLK